jgi:hypothetical protein
MHGPENRYTNIPLKISRFITIFSFSNYANCLWWRRVTYHTGKPPFWIFSYSCLNVHISLELMHASERPNREARTGVQIITSYETARFSRRRRFKSRSSGLWHRVMMWQVPMFRGLRGALSFGLWHRIVVWYDANVSKYRHLFDCDAVKWHGRIPTFRRTILPPTWSSAKRF